MYNDKLISKLISLKNMALSPDQIVDRYKLKSQVTKWRMVALLAFAIVVWFVFGNNKDLTPKSVKARVYSDGYIGRVFIDEMIFDDFDRIDILNNIKHDTRIKALIVHINCPGGTVVAGQNLYHSLRRIAKLKPVVAVLGEVAASGGYMVAIAGDYIIAREGTLTGSIGVVLNTFEVTELAKKLGVEFNVVKTSQYKFAPNPMEKLTPEVRSAIEDTMLDTYDQFFSMVQERRKIPTANLKAIADGRVYTGRQAFKFGLVDALGGEEEAKAWLVKNKGINKDIEITNVKLSRQNTKLHQLLDTAASISNIIKAGVNSRVLQ